MPLLSASRIIILLALLLLVLTGFFPSPFMIGLTAAASSVLVLWQAYAILWDDKPTDLSTHRSRYKGYLNK